MSYTPTEWKDHIVEYPNRFRVVDNGDGTVNILDEHGNVIQQGTPVDASRLNKMEKGIKEAHDLIDAHLNEKVQDGVHGIATTQSLTYYVSPTGNDSNDGLSPSTAFATVQKAIDVLPKILMHDVTIQILDGTFNQGFVVRDFQGHGLLRIIGNLSDPSKVRFENDYAVNDRAIYIAYCSNVNLQGIHLRDTAKSYTRGIFIDACANVTIMNVIVENFGTDGYQGGIYVICSNTIVRECTINNCYSAITAGLLARVYSYNNSGSGNNVGLTAQEAGMLAKRDTQPSGITAESTRWGGVIR